MSGPLKRTTVWPLAAACLCAVVALAAPEAITVHTASTHPMHYHVSLPSGWSAGREWPVLVVIPDAAREFAANLQAFVAARGDRPYILVAPEVLTCGGARTRTLAHYSYTQAVWDSLRGHDDFAFDDDGIAALLADAHRVWHAESRAFLTGWEAGGHTVWALTFRHPERWRGVAPVSTNYQRRGLDSTAFSTVSERARLPIQVFREGAPTGEIVAVMGALEQQTATALSDARAHGYATNPVRVVPGADHGPLASAVLAWCDSLRRR
jgi:pimeloyl-ACP methyl ester carboxylesterase